ncbi:hypothetical protein NDU88_007544 [Pleurodeles waltl]|uniref:Uncharacterized protein n=1 Tax=Pleurodeles waltl TaxID=8319 RepID=A0AAV7VQ28_PLEWA|nr:hypothetical protein NDU88_007544 [Pleurodeles waltl]
MAAISRVRYLQAHMSEMLKEEPSPEERVKRLAVRTMRVGLDVACSTLVASGERHPPMRHFSGLHALDIRREPKRAILAVHPPPVDNSETG